MIVVGNITFKNKTLLEKSTREKLKSLIGKTIDSNHCDFIYLKDLLNRHRDPLNKIGAGIKAFRVTKDTLNKKGTAISVIRIDNTEVDFSWVRCCTQRWKDESDFVIDAMRMATLQTRPYFKKRCEKCKTHEGPFEAHHSDIPFRTIADNFLKQHPEILEAKLTNGAGTFFHKDSNDIAQLWIDYHDTVVRWQYLCKICHNKEDQKLKMKERFMNTINITIQAPELVEAMNRLAEALNTGQIQPVQVETVIEKLEAQSEKPVQAKKETKSKTETTQITLEDVRVRLAQLSQGGKQAEVKNLIAATGATKLTEVPPDKYAQLLEQAEAL